MNVILVYYSNSISLFCWIVNMVTLFLLEERKSKMYNATEIASRINQLLKEKKLSQKDMLENCNLSKNAISSMMSRGSILRADNLARIADYLDCSIDYLMGRNYSAEKSIAFPKFLPHL